MLVGFEHKIESYCFANTEVSEIKITIIITKSDTLSESVRRGVY